MPVIEIEVKHLPMRSPSFPGVGVDSLKSMVSAAERRRNETRRILNDVIQ
jgi:hypothetical protein